MLAIRTIPTLLLRGAGLVKGIKFRDHKYVGDPINAVKIFNEKEVDELLILDISIRAGAGRPNFDLFADIASQAFMPLGYGGALDRMDDVERIFRIGAEKAVFNTSFVENPALVMEASRMAGGQSIVVSLDVKRTLLGKCQVHTHSGTVNTKKDPVELARMAEQCGAGEIIICSVDREGTRSGYDYELVAQVADAVSIPVVASGGAGSLADFRQAVKRGASGVAAGDIFTFQGKYKAVLIQYPRYDDLTRTYSEI